MRFASAVVCSKDDADCSSTGSGVHQVFWVIVKDACWRMIGFLWQLICVSLTIFFDFCNSLAEFLHIALPVLIEEKSTFKKTLAHLNRSENAKLVSYVNYCEPYGTRRKVPHFH